MSTTHAPATRAGATDDRHQQLNLARKEGFIYTCSDIDKSISDVANPPPPECANTLSPNATTPALPLVQPYSKNKKGITFNPNTLSPSRAHRPLFSSQLYLKLFTHYMHLSHTFIYSLSLFPGTRVLSPPIHTSPAHAHPASG